MDNSPHWYWAIFVPLFLLSIYGAYTLVDYKLAEAECMQKLVRNPGAKC